MLLRMWSQLLVLSLLLGASPPVRGDLTDDFLAATPIHPTFKVPEVFGQESEQLKFEAYTNFTGTFTPFADCSENKTDLQLGDYGVIKTPNYPRNYPGRSSCQWYLESPPNTKIEATIFDLYTQPWFFTYFDYVMITRDGNFSKVDRMAGDMNTKTPLTISSELNKLGIRFRSSTLFNFRGMKIHYLVKSMDGNVEKLAPSPYDNVCGQSTILGSQSPVVVIPPLPALPGVVTTTTEATVETTTIPQTDDHIIGPDFASRGSFPWMAAMLIDGRSFCGGSLIDNQAHCTDGAKRITVLLGALDIKSKTEKRLTFNITRENIFQHPDYNPNTITHDITVIKLPEKVNYTDNIRPICLPNRYYVENTFVGEEVRVSGWGKPFDSAPGISPILKNTTANVIANGQCRRFFRSIVTGNLICIGTTFDASPCRGDSGGPLVVKQTTESGQPFFMQLGIVSFGGNSCQKAYPVGFTRVSAFLDYISSVTTKTL
ncbi:Chymotrypsin BI [Folsomia candida]|uniref:Chymotrypsin BI n=1 Tax=Folsomia candida TaxID=158441 RepID=A0A226E209_FOLCA|nr:Chymotrypsin BI [Folsomia candida]